MRWTRTLIPTMKERPAEAEVKSHVLMLRAGMIRRLGSGTYSYLPLGLRSLNKVVNVVREEMDTAGAIELLMPALWPTEIFKETGRLEVFADDLITFTDRHGRPHALAPTHEEVVTAIVRDCLKSYRQLPINLYQIQTKFRDEPRPRFGIIRTREFMMKDAYSFDMDEKGLAGSYEIMYEAYRRIFDRCGVDYVVVEAESGAMGGGASHEFMVPSEVGVAQYVECRGCGYAANVERAEIPPPGVAPARSDAKLKEVETPGCKTIEQVSDFLGAEPARMIKTLIYLADSQPVAALVRGDHEINESKLARALGAGRLELADEQTIEKVSGAPVGFAGPVGMSGVKMVADYAVACMGEGVTGANRKDAHLVGVVPGRDFEADQQADIRAVTAGDACPRCGADITLADGIEIGHVFKLGTKYSAALGATYHDADGNLKPYVMGCYGIGVNRILAAVAECRSDKHGMVWNAEIAPYQVDVIPLDSENARIQEAAEKAYAALKEAGVDVILDDRQEQPGVKFNDADLIGFPLRVILGKGYLKTGRLELQVRRDGSSTEVEPDSLSDAVREALRKA